MLALSRGACNGKIYRAPSPHHPNYPQHQQMHRVKQIEKPLRKFLSPCRPLAIVQIQDHKPGCSDPCHAAAGHQQTLCGGVKPHAAGVIQPAKQRGRKRKTEPQSFWSWPDQRKSRVNTGASSAQSQNNEPKSAVRSARRAKNGSGWFRYTTRCKTQEQREHHVEILKFQNAVLGKRHRERHL